MSWTKAGARMAGGDKEFDRLVPSAIFVEDSMVPRSHAVLESVVESMEALEHLRVDLRWSTAKAPLGSS